MKKIIVTGSLAYDFIMDYPQTFAENILPHKVKSLSVSFLVENFSKNFGGVAGNIAYNLSLLNKNAAILASGGENDFHLYELHLRENNIDDNYINRVQEEFTANMFMMTDKNNCQIAGFYPGAMSQDETLSLDTIKSTYGFVVVAPTMPAAMDRFVKETKRKKIPYLYDPAQQIPRLSKAQLNSGVSGAEIVIGNDYELALLTKKANISKKELLKKAKVVITTLGEKGSTIETANKKINVSIAKPKKIIDPTGAGDAYIAGFLSSYIESRDLVICGQMGATLASFAIEQYGTQKHSASHQTFKNRYTQSFGKMIESDD